MLLEEMSLIPDLLFKGLCQFNDLGEPDRSDFNSRFIFSSSILQSVTQIYIHDARGLFLSQFWTLLNWAVFSEAAGAVQKISSCLQNLNRNQLKLAQIHETHSMPIPKNPLNMT